MGEGGAGTSGSQVVRSLTVQAKEAGLYFLMCNKAKKSFYIEE